MTAVEMETYSEAMAALIEEWTPTAGDFVPAIIGHKLADFLRETDPDLLAGWLDERAAMFLTRTITERLRSVRARTLSQAAASRFAAAAAAAEDGDYEPLSHFAVVYAIDDENTRRPVGEMTGADHRFVASNYQASGRYDLMLAAFHEKVAKKVGSRTTADVFSEEQYDAMLRSLTGAKA